MKKFLLRVPGTRRHRPSHRATWGSTRVGQEENIGKVFIMVSKERKG